MSVVRVERRRDFVLGGGGGGGCFGGGGGGLGTYLITFTKVTS